MFRRLLLPHSVCRVTMKEVELQTRHAIMEDEGVDEMKENSNAQIGKVQCIERVK